VSQTRCCGPASPTSWGNTPPLAWTGSEHEVCPWLGNGRIPLLINVLYKYKAILRQKKPAERQFFQRGMVIACRTILKFQVPRDRQLTFRIWLPRRLILTLIRPTYPREQIERFTQKMASSKWPFLRNVLKTFGQDFLAVNLSDTFSFKKSFCVGLHKGKCASPSGHGLSKFLHP